MPTSTACAHRTGARCCAAHTALLLGVLALGCGAGAEQETTSLATPVPQSSPSAPAPQAFTAADIDRIGRLAQPSNDLRLAVLEDELRQRGLPFHQQEFSHTDANGGRSGGGNVVVALGSGPPDIVVGGHFDAERLADGVLVQGMVDNGAGVFVLLRVAEALRAAVLRGSVHVVFFDMEELGLIGSRAYVERLDPALDAVMVNVDIVAYGDTLFYGPDGPSAAETRLAAAVRRACVRHAAACVGTPRMPPSDDRSFRGAGIPAVSLAMLPADEAHRLWLILNGDLSDPLRTALAPPIMRTIHSPRDTADKLEPAALTRAARIVTDLVVGLDAARR